MKKLLCPHGYDVMDGCNTCIQSIGLTVGMKVKRKDNGKIYHNYEGKIVRHQIWDAITLEGQECKRKMFCVRDAHGEVWYDEYELQEVK